MKRIMILVVSVATLVFLFGSAWGQADFDWRKVTRLRWMDPSRDPITYREYLASRQFATELEAQLVYTGGKGDTPICIVINNLLYLAVTGSFSTFVSDLELDGYAPNIYTALNDGDETGLKDLLISEWNTRGIAGAVLVGDLPVAWYEMENWDHEEFPIDLFFMDLDGSWVDLDTDGMYDDHYNGAGDVEADIWLGRLSAFNLTDHEAHEATLMNNYLAKNHRYRTGDFTLLDKALVYIDDDWHTARWDRDVTLAYPNTDAVKDPYQTTREDYMLRVRESLDNRYESLLICAHSSPHVHALYWGDGPYDYSLFYNHEIEEIDVQVLFYNLFACSNSRYVEQDDMGNWYVFQSQYGLVSVGSTKTGSMLCFDDYYHPLGEGLTFGEAFLFWCVNDIETCAGEDSRPWFYGMTMSGDPTLRVSRFMPDRSGDVNWDGQIDLSDVVFLMNYLFKGGDSPEAQRLGDPSADCRVDLADVVYLLNYLYKGGPPPGVGCA
jgi:hypothetical protein